MGIFDRFAKGPELTKEQALMMSTGLALNLYKGDFTLEQLLANAEPFLELLFKDSFPSHSIRPEQSRQILKHAVRIYHEEREHLEKLMKLQIYINNPVPENQPKEKVITPDHFRNELTLFKD